MEDDAMHCEIMGVIETHIAGAEHYPARAAVGEAVVLERDPQNHHDPNAVRVMNAHGEQVGYLPRRLVAWLAPLLDSRAVSLAGTVVRRPDGHHRDQALDLRVMASAHAHDWVKNSRRVDTLRDVLHNVVFQAYLEAQTCDNPALIRDLAQRLWLLDRGDLTPETRLLLSLLPGRARVAERLGQNRVADMVRDALLGLRLGAPVGYDRLQLFPLYGGNGHARHHAILSEAIEGGTAEVREVSDVGSVPELMVVNRGDRPLLIPEGEILSGAKQNRVVNITVLVAEKSELVIPVSCVERGRWSKVSPGFRATHFAPPRARGRKSAGVMAQRNACGRPVSDQGRLWDNVAEYLDRAGAHSGTDSLIDAYEQARERLNAYRKHVRLPDDARGAVIALGGKVVGVEVFGTHDMLAGLWERLSEAYFFEAATDPEPVVPEGDADASDAQQFLETVGAGLTPVDRPVGAGVEFHVNAENVAGSALWHDGHLLHVAAFEALS
ncbi:MAG: HIRAN domain-containing protein [Candidatus Hydrogenedentes bacterium]|nr:HIRAN domain-containing protein [Candidatus Hydrogenedentota bacterium]